MELLLVYACSCVVLRHRERFYLCPFLHTQQLYAKKYWGGAAVLNVKLFIIRFLQGCLRLQCVMRGWLGWQQMLYFMLHG
jgi:hypothetical protein